MKKIAVILAIMMMPSFAFALDTISDADLDNVSGQAGVSILINSVIIIKSANVSAYGDSGAVGGTRWISLVQEDSVTTKIGFHGEEPLMIDIVNVSSLASLSTSGWNLNMEHVGTTGVEITLPDMICIESSGQTDTIYMSASATGGARTDEETLISRYTGGGTTKIVGALNDSALYGVDSYMGAGPEQTKILITTHGH